MRNRNEAMKLLTEVFPNRTHVTETERYFAKGLESAAPTVNEENKMPTVQNLSEVQRKCGVRGSDELHERNQRRQPQTTQGRGDWRVPEERRGRDITPRQKPSREERGGGELTMILWC